MVLGVLEKPVPGCGICTLCILAAKNRGYGHGKCIIIREMELNVCL